MFASFINKYIACCNNKNAVVNIEIENKQQISWQDTKPFIPPINGGVVIKVYDGDTITIASTLTINSKTEMYRFSIRLSGIDAAEIKSKNEDEQIVAREARDCLSNLILHKYVSIKNINMEKYGRILADVYFKDIHINKWMLSQRFAVDYDGGTKKSPASWLKYRLTGQHNQI